ncbi:MAG: DNA gyrase subunit A [Bacteroidetes bacterium]|nr:DNA gyrase subunit A [Bacteroidota bacterium]
MSEFEKITKVDIGKEMKSCYIDYSMSVIVSRALPDVRDGLKPVHRRVLYGMSKELNLYSNKKHMKSARVVGEVMGKYHPHGDSSVYNTMVRMAQPWSMRYPLVDGQGNFGSVDGDNPAAMRYTEARMAKIAEETIADIDYDTVDFQSNFDETHQEPTVLPTRIPLLLVNGTSGIAVGMATNMPPHNLTEVVNALCATIDNPEITIDELCEYIKAPDFPTGGIIYGYEGVKQAYLTGRGRVVMRSKTEIETTEKGREKIIITEIPYLVNKAEMVRKIADLVNDKRIEGISYINDESDREGTRVVIVLKNDAVASVVLNKLFKYSDLQTSFSINSITLVNGRPRLLNLKEQLECFIAHRHEVVVRRTRFLLKKAEDRDHILQGLLIAQANIDEVIRVIKESQTPEDAKNNLKTRFSLSEIQATAIIDMRLRALTGLEEGKLKAEHDELAKKIEGYTTILSDENLQMTIIKDEMLEIKEKYGDERRSEIVFSSEEFNPEDFYADDDMVITISHLGYIKRTPLSDYRTQARGGVGSKGSATRNEDFIEHIFFASMHSTLMLFTELGRCFWLKVYQIPEGSRQSKGRAIQNLLNITPDDKVRAYMNVKNLKDEEFINNNYVVMCTRSGMVKKTLLEKYSRPRANGVNAIIIKEGDQLIDAQLTNGDCEILLAAYQGKANRFHESHVRTVGRTSQGVRGINIEGENRVIGMVISPANITTDILVISENGYGKRTSIDDYRITNRGGKGVKTLTITEKTGNLVSIKSVSDDNDLMIINKSGMTIRIPVESLRVMGRATQGVRVIHLKNDDSIASLTIVPKTEEEEEVVLEEGAVVSENESIVSESETVLISETEVIVEKTEE